MYDSPSVAYTRTRTHVAHFPSCVFFIERFDAVFPVTRRRIDEIAMFRSSDATSESD